MVIGGAPHPCTTPFMTNSDFFASNLEYNDIDTQMTHFRDICYHIYCFAQILMSVMMIMVDAQHSVRTLWVAMTVPVMMVIF